MVKLAVVLAQVVRSTKTEWTDLSDQELLQRFAQSEDQRAFALLVKRHSLMVLGVCRRVLHSQTDAEDACQAVFWILAKKAKTTRWQSSVVNWLYTTALKVSRNARLAIERRNRREGSVAVPESVPPVDSITGPELVSILQEELDKLPARYREPLVLCYLEGLTRDEAATCLGVPVTTLKSQLERGRKRLAEALTKRGLELGSILLATATTSVARASLPRLTESILATLNGLPSHTVAMFAQGAVMTGIRASTKWVICLGISLTIVAFGFWFRQPMTAQTQKSSTDKMEKSATKVETKNEKTKPDTKARTIRGQVLNPEGKPVAGAKLYQPYSEDVLPVSQADILMEELGQTDADGRFRVTLSKKAPREYLIAHQKGLGVDWILLDETVDPNKEQTLRLVNDVPITGQILNTEGKPIQGVQVSILSIYVPRDEKLDDYLDGWTKDLREAMSSPNKRLYVPLNKISGSMQTDANGKFTLTGAGAERIVHLLIEGAGVARSNPYVITRPKFDPKPYNDVLLKKDHDDLRLLNFFRGLYAPHLTYVADPGKIIEGTVIDANTGKPIANCVVDSSTGFGDRVICRTDAKGQYRLEGIPKQKNGYHVQVNPPKDSGYMRVSSGALDNEGFQPIRHDIKIRIGTVVTGRVIDKQTGKGVRAGVRLVPLPGNKNFGATPGSDSYRFDRTMRSTDAEGRFRLTTIPGQSLLMAQVQDDAKFNGEYLNRYRRASYDPDHKDLFQYDAEDDSWIVTAVDNTIEFLGTEHAVKVLDVRDKEETKIELKVDPGVTSKIEIQDPDGKPLTGVYMAGLTDSWPITYKLPEATATVYGLNPEKPRTIALYHPQKKLGAIATIRGDEKEAVVIKLATSGTITGRFTEENVPLKGAEITINPPSRIFSELYRFTLKDRKLALTDQEGRFTLQDIVPGMKFYFQIRKGEEFFGGKPKLGEQTLQAGETKDLGERNVERLR